MRLLLILFLVFAGCSDAKPVTKVKTVRVCKIVLITADKWFLLSEVGTYQRNWMDMDGFMSKSQLGWNAPADVVYELDDESESMRRVMVDEKTRRQLRLSTK